MAVGETGAELLARLQTSHISLTDLEPQLFPAGPLPGQLVELCGKPGSGKSKYVMHVIANAIQSTVYEGLPLGGLGASVILIDTDHLFSLLHLVSVLEHRVMAAMDSHNERVAAKGTPMNGISSEDELKDGGIQSIHLSDEQVEACVKNCLVRLYVVRCMDHSQLLMTLHSLESLLTYKPDIRLLIIDSLTAFSPPGDGQRYWETTQTFPDSNVKFISDIVKKILSAFKVFAMVVTNASFDTKYVRCNKRLATSVVQNVGKRNGCEGNVEKHAYEDETSRREKETSAADLGCVLTVWQIPVARRFVFSKCLPDPVVGGLKGHKDKLRNTSFEQELFSISSRNGDNYRFKIVAGGIEFIEN